MDAPESSHAIVAALWRAAGLDAQALDTLALPGREPALPSSFRVSSAAQSSLGAAALAAAEIHHHRSGSPRQQVTVPLREAALETIGWFTIDGVQPPTWDKLSGLYRCGDPAAGEWVRIHANFEHHRDGALRLLGLPTGAQTERADVERALRDWRAEAFEEAAARAGLVVACARSFAQWDAHPQSQAVAAEPLVTLAPIGAPGDAPPLPLPALDAGARPLSGLRVLDLTRILAGPVCGRTLAGYGADVMLVNSPSLPNISAIASTSRGKLSTHVDLRSDAGRATLRRLVGDARVFVQGYRPGGIEALGFGPQALAEMRPGVVSVSLAAYGFSGPWSGRRGFDSLVQTTTGLNVAEAQAFGAAEPRALPMQILDYAAGYLMAFGAQAALLRQAREGGSWQVRVSLAGVGRWLRSLGRLPDGPAGPRPLLDAVKESYDSGFGRIETIRHAAQFSATPPAWPRSSMPPGSHPPTWP